MLDEGTHPNGDLRPPGFLGGDHNQPPRGHILARILGGSADMHENLFTITQNPANSPGVPDLEQAVHNEESDGKIVMYEVYPEYSDDQKDSVPKHIQLKAYEENGSVIVDTILDNPAHARQQQRRGLP